MTIAGAEAGCPAGVRAVGPVLLRRPTRTPTADFRDHRRNVWARCGAAAAQADSLLACAQIGSGMMAAPPAGPAAFAVVASGTDSIEGSGSGGSIR